MVTKLINYSNNQGSFVGMIFTTTENDHLMILKLNQSERTFEIVSDMKLPNKIHSLCLSASLHHKGQAKDSKYASENNYYIENSGDSEGGYLSSQMMMFGLNQGQDSDE
eukprot:CAMPEP_0116881722 /NCGR_PEP_ID=MMETSP0463-20121206/13789_1 /TAXON_ID=181622 /ORGANISM="Strombidinopsis sp, Strain SopsisLIS2011" /LENGTH=108 /DNA_ID=CAMNT_0004533861 /DNA_START=1392 /DNA_END=1718 /DNA_ORIENTATION=+